MNRFIKFHEASRSHQARIKRMIRGKLLQLQNEILFPHGLKFSRIEIDNAQTEIQQSIEHFKCDIIYHNLIDAEEISIRKVISIKDTHNISDITYSSLRNDLELKLPSLYELKKEIKNFDEMLAIMQNTKGVYLNIKEKLKLLIPKIKKNFVDKDSSICILDLALMVHR